MPSRVTRADKNEIVRKALKSLKAARSFIIKYIESGAEDRKAENNANTWSAHISGMRNVCFILELNIYDDLNAMVGAIGFAMMTGDISKIEMELSDENIQ